MHYEDREKEIKDIRSIRERRSRVVHYRSVVDLGFEREVGTDFLLHPIRPCYQPPPPLL
jgi:hypothetical protein